MRIFVCSQYSGETETNVINTEKYCKYVLDAGCSPYAPHLYLPKLLDDNVPAQRVQGIQVGMEFLEACLQIWVFRRDGITSPGMIQEIEFAKRNRIKIIYIGNEVMKRILE